MRTWVGFSREGNDWEHICWMMQRVSAPHSSLNRVVNKNSEHQASINLLSIPGPSALLPSQPCFSPSLHISERHFAYDVHHTVKLVALSRCPASDSPTDPPTSVLPTFEMYQHFTPGGINPHSPCQRPLIPLSSSEDQAWVEEVSHFSYHDLCNFFQSPSLF